MNFRAVIFLKRILAPATLALPVAVFLIPNVSTPVWVLSALPMFAVQFLSNAMNWKLERQHFLPMRCPLCNRVGLAGRGVTWAVGWWLQCDDCGTVKPHGILGLNFRIEPPGEPIDGDEEEDNEL